MKLDYWYKQTLDKPISPELIWSQPENRQLAGKLIIIGGNLHGFAAPAEAYIQAVKAGIGIARVVIPDSIKTLLEHSQGNDLGMEFAPSTPSGSFSLNALAEILSLCGWADGVLLAGDFGRNSETAILLERLITKYCGQLTLSNDTIDYFINNLALILQRPNTTLVLNLLQLQKLFMQAHQATPITSDMDLIRLVKVIHDFTLTYPVNFVINHAKYILVAVNGQVSSTVTSQSTDIKQGILAAQTAIWWLQNPNKIFEAISCGILIGSK